MIGKEEGTDFYLHLLLRRKKKLDFLICLKILNALSFTQDCLKSMTAEIRSLTKPLLDQNSPKMLSCSDCGQLIRYETFSPGSVV